MHVRLPDFAASLFNKERAMSTCMFCFVSMVTVSPLAGLKQSMPKTRLRLRIIGDTDTGNFISPFLLKVHFTVYLSHVSAMPSAIL